MVSLIFKLAIAITAIKLLVTVTALPAAASPRIDDRQIVPAPGRCNNYGNRNARVNPNAVKRVYSWQVGNPTPYAFGTPYCFLVADSAYPDAIRWAWPIIGSTQWLVIYTSPNGRFVGFGFLTGGEV